MKLAPKGTLPDAALEQGYVFVKCGSHRARGHLDTNGAQSYYSLRRNTYYGVYAIKDIAELPTGITRIRGPFGDLNMCWRGE